MVTRKDVAKLANVSITVVSRVINNSGYVSHVKREAVLQAVEELKYRPNPVAASLKNGKTRQILFYRGGLSNIYHLELYRGMEDRAQEAGYIVFMSGDLHIKQIQGMMMDGIILAFEAFVYSEYVRYIQKYRLPYVIVGYGESIPKDIYSVMVDTRKGMREILAYLRGKGHHRIAYAGENIPRTEEPRNATFRAVMGSYYGKKLDRYLLGSDKTSTGDKAGDYYQIGKIAAEQFVERRLDATAVACFNDDIAVSFCRRIRQLGYRIPEDISITGFDGLIMGEYQQPALTSLSLNTYEHGRACTRIILDMIEGKQPPHTRRISTQLIERESVLSI
jgi:DNA-binding LacI/PurR family transcriptional regulator